MAWGQNTMICDLVMGRRISAACVLARDPEFLRHLCLPGAADFLRHACLTWAAEFLRQVCLTGAAEFLRHVSFSGNFSGMVGIATTMFQYVAVNFI